jgi:hypothetical protein
VVAADDLQFETRLTCTAIKTAVCSGGGPGGVGCNVLTTS